MKHIPRPGSLRNVQHPQNAHATISTVNSPVRLLFMDGSRLFNRRFMAGVSTCSNTHQTHRVVKVRVTNRVPRGANAVSVTSVSTATPPPSSHKTP